LKHIIPGRDLNPSNWHQLPGKGLFNESNLLKKAVGQIVFPKEQQIPARWVLALPNLPAKSRERVKQK
jgi:hypothetical protein